MAVLDVPCSPLQVDVDRDSLPLGDYLWLVLPQGQQEAQHTAAAAAAGRGGAAAGGWSDVDDEDEESAAAAERSRCLVAGAVVERKTVRPDGSVGCVIRWIGVKTKAAGR